MRSLTRAAQGADPELQGTVRVTVPPIVAAELLAEDFVVFCSRWPQIELEISGSYEVVSLGQQRADVAIRFMPVGVTTTALRPIGSHSIEPHVAATGSAPEQHLETGYTWV
jgi:DNA-binding transcriptional LysR family regulator